jgi:hypothetical protein
MECATDGEILYVDVQTRLSLVFAAGRPDSWLVGADHAVESIEGTTIYGRADGRFSPIGWLDVDRNRALLMHVGLQPDEQILVARNGVSAILLPRSDDHCWHRIEELASIATSLAEYSTANPDLNDPTDDHPTLPQEFLDLEPLAKIWAEPDDHIRAALMTAASTTKLKELVRAVSPHLVRIAALLGTREPLSDELVHLEFLALATVEARMELERRQATH